MHRFLLLALLWIAPQAAAQQRAAIHGYVTDATSSETLLLATVHLSGTTTGAATNNAGYYTISGIEPGTYTIVISYVGYRTERTEVTLAAGEQRRLDLALSPETVLGAEVLVTADREEEEARTRIGAAQMPVRLVTQLPSVFEADVFRSIQLLPGVKAASDFSSGLYIRGGSPDQTMILLDRTTVYNPTHFFGFFSTFNPDALKDVQIYKGGYPAEYGGRLGSVIDIYNKDGNRRHHEGRVTVGALASRAAIEGPHRRGSWMIAARRSTLDPLLSAMRGSVDGIPDLFYFYDLNGKINFDVTQADRVSLAVYGGADQLKVTPMEEFKINLAYGNRTGSLNWSHIYSEQVFSNVTFTGSRYFSRPFLRFAGTEIERVNEVDDLSVKADVQYVPDQRHTVQAGLWSGALTLRLRDWFEDEEKFNSLLESYHGSAYVQHTWRPTPHWMIRSGLRANAFTSGNYWRLEPRLSLEHRRSDALRFQLAYGRYHQFLSLITNEAFSGGDVWLMSAGGVPPSWGDQYVFGVKTVPVFGFRVDAEVYYRTMSDLFELDPNRQDYSGMDYADIFRFGDGYAYGAELFVERSIGRLTGFAGYTFGRTRRRFPTVNEGRYFPPKYDRTHDVNVVANYGLNRRWRLASTFTYGTGQAYTRPTGRVSYEVPFRGDPIENIVVGRINASRLPSYHRLDVGVARTGRFFRMADSELQFQIINVYNRRNPWFYDYDLSKNPAEVSTVRMLPILPNISYSLKF